MNIRTIASLMLLLSFIMIGNEAANSQAEGISSPYAFGDPLAPSSSCIPYGIGDNISLFSECWGTPDNTYCSGTIRKKVRYKIQFPDGSPTITSDLSATGQVDMGVSCQGGCSIGPPYLLKECWPQFYQPQIGRNYFRVTAYGAKTVPMLDPLGCCSRGLCVPYVWYHYCDPSGVDSEIEWEHSCSFFFNA
jgi:hypothetical protein